MEFSDRRAERQRADAEMVGLMPASSEFKERARIHRLQQTSASDADLRQSLSVV